MALVIPYHGSISASIQYVYNHSGGKLSQFDLVPQYKAPDSYVRNSFRMIVVPPFIQPNGDVDERMQDILDHYDDYTDYDDDLKYLKVIGCLLFKCWLILYFLILYYIYFA